MNNDLARSLSVSVVWVATLIAGEGRVLLNTEQVQQREEEGVPEQTSSRDSRNLVWFQVDRIVSMRAKKNMVIWHLYWTKTVGITLGMW